MDTRTGEIVNLTELEADEARQKWLAWEAGLLKEMPRYAPIKNDSMPVRPKRRRKAQGRRSYKESCNG